MNCTSSDELPQAESPSQSSHSSDNQSSGSTADSIDETPSPMKKCKGLNAVLNHILPKVQPQRESNQTMTLIRRYNKEKTNYLDQPIVESDHSPLQ